MSNETPDVDRRYILGHSNRELDRLRAQASLLAPTTRQFLCAAGVGRGMRVLDVGSGTGDVAFLAADIVGETGFVLGADKSATAVTAATATAQEIELSNVAFEEGDPAKMVFEKPFDAVIGRYVLPFQDDVAAKLRGFSKHLVPGGVMVFHEPDWTCVRSSPPVPLYDQVCQWCDETTRLSGHSWSFLDKAHQSFTAAGLPAPTMRMHTYVAGGSAGREWIMALCDIVGSLLPTMVEYGVVAEQDVGLATLPERLLQDIVSSNSLIVGRSEIGIWATVP